MSLTMSRRRLIMLVAPIGITITSGAANAAKLNGDIDSSSKWGSSRMDFGQGVDFKGGQILKILLADDSAKNVLVRILPLGQDPREPVGLLNSDGGGKIFVVKDRTVTVTLHRDYRAVGQISVHGGERAWNYRLGAGNGPAQILDIEILP